MHSLTSALLYVWNYNLDYTKRLLKDIPDERMAYNPSAVPAGIVLNHPAWVLSHLSVYHPVAARIVKSIPLEEDPQNHKFGMKSKPEPDASVYLPKEVLLDNFERGHAAVADALNTASPEIFDAAPTLERWKSRFRNNAELLGYITCYHESTHLGQLSVWRRVQGLPSV